MITINEMTITVPGNVVKNLDPTGKNSLLRMTQDQLQCFYDQVGPVLDFLNGLANGSPQTFPPVNQTLPPTAVAGDGSKTGA